MSCVTNSIVTPKRCHTDADQVLEVGAGLRVDRGERLVHQQHPRLVGQGPGDRDPLLHAAGELPRVGRRGVGQPDRRERLVDQRRAARALGSPLALQRQLDVVAHASATGTGCGRTPGRRPPARAAGRRPAVPPTRTSPDGRRAAARRGSAAAWSCRSRTGRRRRRTRPAATVNVRSRERLHLAAVPVVDLAQAADLEHRRLLISGRARRRAPRGTSPGPAARRAGTAATAATPIRPSSEHAAPHLRDLEAALELHDGEAEAVAGREHLADHHQDDARSTAPAGRRS